MKLDEIDKKLLEELQKDCKQHIDELSKKVGIGKSAVHRRIKILEKEGVIKKYTAILDPEKVDCGFSAYFLCKPTHTKTLNWDVIGKELTTITGVLDVCFITGEWDYLVKIRCKSEKEYYKIVDTVAKTISNYTIGLIAPKHFKEDTFLQIPK